MGSCTISDSFFQLPRTVDGWPWARQINPYYAEVKADSANWFRSFNAFGPKAQAAFDLCDFSLLASLAYPKLNKEQLRTGCDMMMLFFVFDEYTDDKSASVVEHYAGIVMDALHHPEIPRPVNECLLGEVARQFWALAVKSSSPMSQKRFIQTFARYTAAVVEQAADRDRKHVRSIEEYMYLRRFTIGAEPSYIPLILSMDLPDEVIDHPAIVSLSAFVTDMIIFDNDICSYNKEQAAGDDLHNILTIVMKEKNVSLEGALAWVAQHHKDAAQAFLENWKSLPHWSPEIDSQVEEYIHGIGHWVRANDCWNFESGRYFGRDGLEIQKHRTVRLAAKKLF
ncbi:Terpenoid synthase [Mycena sanguinolenta]|uniref:Terpene synthase n=1 Tax=Mycena sanguinolenta TaxID=230812 RepID=A0A8H6XQP1_9AGAR|nr:Terpenoid synthase [Mycena sanguinolenta]